MCNYNYDYDTGSSWYDSCVKCDRLQNQLEQAQEATKAILKLIYAKDELNVFELEAELDYLMNAVDVSNKLRPQEPIPLQRTVKEDTRSWFERRYKEIMSA
jgi:DNA replication initiation complex subunit (GINS family)